jgi:hypothetical protein
MRNLRGMFAQDVAVHGSGTPKPESLFKTNAEFLVTERTSVYEGLTRRNTSCSYVIKPNQTFGLASNQPSAVAM